MRRTFLQPWSIADRAAELPTTIMSNSGWHSGVWDPFSLGRVSRLDVVDGSSPVVAFGRRSEREKLRRHQSMGQ